MNLQITSLKLFLSQKAIGHSINLPGQWMSVSSMGIQNRQKSCDVCKIVKNSTFLVWSKGIKTKDTNHYYKVVFWLWIISGDLFMEANFLISQSGASKMALSFFKRYRSFTLYKDLVQVLKKNQVRNLQILLQILHHFKVDQCRMEAISSNKHMVKMEDFQFWVVNPWCFCWNTSS